MTLVDVADRRRGHEDEDVIALLLQRDRQPLDDLGVEVVFEIGDHEADDAARPVISERARTFGR